MRIFALNRNTRKILTFLFFLVFILLFLIVPIALLAQDDGIMVTLSLQPLATFKATLLEQIPGVALYSVMACNLTPIAQPVGGGQLYQAAWERGVTTINHQLQASTIEAARERSKLYKATRVLYWLSWGGQIYVGVKGPKINGDWKSAVPIVTAATVQISDIFQGKGLNARTIQLLDPKEQIQLGPKGSGCEERLIMGGYRKEPLSPVLIRVTSSVSNPASSPPSRIVP